MSESSVSDIAGVKAECNFTLPHQRATSKSRLEGYEPSEEEARDFKPCSNEQKSGSSAIHRGGRSRAVRKEKQTGVRYFLKVTLIEK